MQACRLARSPIKKNFENFSCEHLWMVKIHWMSQVNILFFGEYFVYYLLTKTFKGKKKLFSNLFLYVIYT